MISILARIIIISSLLFIPHITSAETKIFIKEYTYQASEADSKLTCRAIAFEQAKRLLLEELGTYLESYTEVKNFQLTTDKIVALTAGIVRTEKVAEKWDGEKYWIKVKIDVDPDDVSKHINDVRQDRTKSKELEELREKLALYQKENEELRHELRSTKGLRVSVLKEKYSKNIESITAIDKVQEGYSYLNKLDLKKAVALFTEAIKIAPHKDEPYIGRSITNALMGTYEEALRDSSKVIEISPLKAIGYYLKAYTYQLMGKNNLSIQLLERAIALDPKESFLYAYRGYLFGKVGENSRALDDFNKALEIDSKFSYLYCYRGQYYFEAVRDYRKAQTDFQEAVRLDPHNALAYMGIAMSLSASNSYDEGMEYVSKAIDILPVLGPAYMVRADIYKKQGKFDQALNDLSKGIELIPKGIGNLSFAYRERADIYKKKKMYKEAVNDYSHSISLDPKETYGYEMRAELLIEMNLYDDAIKDYTTIIDINPQKSKYIYWKRALAYSQKKDADKALSDCKYSASLIGNDFYKVAVADKEMNKAILLLLSDLYLQKKEYEKANEFSNMVVKEDPGISHAYVVRGHSYLGLKRIDEAINDFQKGCDLGNQQACNNVKLANQIMSDSAKALEKSSPNTLRIFKPGDYINYRLTGYIIANGVEIPVNGTAQWKVLEGIQADYYGKLCKISRQKMQVIASSKGRVAAITISGDQYFTQDSSGSYLIHGSSFEVTSNFSPPRIVKPKFVRVPEMGWYEEYKSPLTINESISYNIQHSDGSSTSKTNTVIAEEEISCPAGEFNAIKIVSSSFSSDDKGSESKDMSIDWVVPRIGPIKSIIEVFSGNEKWKFQLEMTDTNVI